MALLFLVAFLVTGLHWQSMIVDGKPKDDCKAKQDIVFVVDASSSICDGGNSSIKSPPPCPDWFKCLKFMRGLVEGMTIGPDDVQVACIVFYENAEIRFKLNTITDKQELLNRIDNLVYSTGGTNTKLALEYLIDKVLIPKAGDRPDVPNTAIIITDGYPSIQVEKVPDAIMAVHDLGFRVISVGVGSGVQEDFIKELSSPPKELNVNYFLATDYAALGKIQEAVKGETCKPPPPPPTCSSESVLENVKDPSKSIKTNFPGDPSKLYSSEGSGVNWDVTPLTLQFSWPETQSTSPPIEIRFTAATNLDYYRVKLRKNNYAIVTDPINSTTNVYVLNDIGNVNEVTLDFVPVDYWKEVIIENFEVIYCVKVSKPGQCEQKSNIFLGKDFEKAIKPNTSAKVLVTEAKATLKGNMTLPFIEVDVKSIPPFKARDFTQVSFDCQNNFNKVAIEVTDGGRPVKVYHRDGVATNEFSSGGVYFASGVKGDRIRVTLEPTPSPNKRFTNSVQFRHFAVHACV